MRDLVSMASPSEVVRYLASPLGSNLGAFLLSGCPYQARSAASGGLALER